MRGDETRTKANKARARGDEIRAASDDGSI